MSIRSKKQVAAIAGLLSAAACAIPIQNSKASGSGCHTRPRITNFVLVGFYSAPIGTVAAFSVTFQADGGSGRLHGDGDSVGWGEFFRNVHRQTQEGVTGARWWKAGSRHTQTVSVETECGGDVRSMDFTVPAHSEIEPLPKNLGGMTTKYVSIGDSYSSGEGNPPFSVNQKYHTSQEAWPNILTGALGITVTNLACSGAHTDALWKSYRAQPPQLESLAKLRPDVMTVTIGGNDVDFGQALYSCFRYDCSKGKLLKNGAAVEHMRQQLTKTYQRIKAAVPYAMVVVVGYPRLFPETQGETRGCGWLSSAERTQFNQLTVDFNAIASTEAQEVGLKFVWVLNALRGHELCSFDSWMFKLTPACLHDSRCGHPLLKAQQAIAGIVRSAIGPV